MDSIGTTNYLVLFADVAGSTRLYESLGDAKAKQAITELQSTISAAIIEAGGNVHEIVGDEVMAYFRDAQCAVNCACRIQEATASLQPVQGKPMAVRIGIHGGPVIFDGSRMFGDTINLAARMVGIAQGGQIITTSFVAERLPSSMAHLVRQFDVVKVKGKHEPVVIYDLLWQPQDMTAIQVVPQATSRPTALLLTHRGIERRLSTEQTPFAIGRSQSCHLVIVWGSISRRHAVIEYNRGHFVLCDNSTNGCHVLTATGEVLFLRRETLPLWGAGRIALGAPLNEGYEHIVEFSCC